MGQGTIVGDGYSVSWRTLDAQYWGVPQRRKRIYLVTDFGGGTAPEILFEQDSLRGDIKESKEERQDIAGSSKESTTGSDREDVIFYDIGDRRRVADQGDTSPMLTRKMRTGGSNKPIILENHPNDSRVDICEDGIFPTLTGRMGTGGGNVPMVIDKPTAFNLTQDPISADMSPFLTSGTNMQTIIEKSREYIVRRLTPTECGRLQGFPNGWADNLGTAGPIEDDILYWRRIFKEYSESLGVDKKEKTDNQIRRWLQNPESDSAKYKMWGNGIALPCAAFVMEGIAHELQRRSMKEITINVPDGTQLLHVLAVVDMGKEIHYETRFCDLRDGKSEYTLDSCNKEGE